MTHGQNPILLLLEVSRSTETAPLLSRKGSGLRGRRRSPNKQRYNGGGPQTAERLSVYTYSRKTHTRPWLVPWTGLRFPLGESAFSKRSTEFQLRLWTKRKRGANLDL